MESSRLNHGILDKQLVKCGNGATRQLHNIPQQIVGFNGKIYPAELVDAGIQHVYRITLSNDCKFYLADRHPLLVREPFARRRDKAHSTHPVGALEARFTQQRGNPSDFDVMMAKEYKSRGHCYIRSIEYVGKQQCLLVNTEAPKGLITLDCGVVV